LGISEEYTQKYTHATLTRNPDLRSVVEAWGTIPGALKAAILAIVQSCGNESQSK
jgi:hypothetical protein